MTVQFFKQKDVVDAFQEVCYSTLLYSKMSETLYCTDAFWSTFFTSPPTPKFGKGANNLIKREEYPDFVCGCLMKGCTGDEVSYMSYAK